MIGREGSIEDYQRFLSLTSLPHTTVGINHVPRWFPYYLDYYFGIDLLRLPRWIVEDGKRMKPWLDCNIGRNLKQGTSSLCAFRVYRECIYPDPTLRTVFVGTPLTGPYKDFLYGWELCIDLLRTHARSMSGNTRALLGEPTREWLEGDRDEGNALL